MHLVNYGLSPDYTWQVYGIWPWTTGVAIFICMMFMYGAIPHNVKWAHFEVRNVGVVGAVVRSNSHNCLADLLVYSSLFHWVLHLPNSTWTWRVQSQYMEVADHCHSVLYSRTPLPNLFGLSDGRFDVHYQHGSVQCIFFQHHSPHQMKGNVIAIGFDRKSAFPNGYKEGQYLYLNAPHVSEGEWHPFTISSAPQVNSRVIGHVCLNAKCTFRRKT